MSVLVLAAKRISFSAASAKTDLKEDEGWASLELDAACLQELLGDGLRT